jgi:outer membrane protease
VNSITKYLLLIIMLASAPALRARDIPETEAETAAPALHTRNVPDAPAPPPAAARSFRFYAAFDLLGGFVYGAAAELVYGAPGGAEFLSRLDWDMKPLYTYGAVLSLFLDTPLVSLSPWLRLGAKSGIYGSTGYMEDRDWMDAALPWLTHFSRHDNHTAAAFFLEGELGLYWRPSGRENALRLDFFVRASWMKITFMAADGYTQYAAQGNFWQESLPKSPHSGPAIDYIQEWLILAPGIGAEFPFGRFFSAGLAVAATPLVFGKARDWHYVTGDQFSDYPDWGVYAKPELHFSFSPARWITFLAFASWTWISGARGPGYMNQNLNGEAGAGLNALEAGIALRLNP